MTSRKNVIWPVLKQVFILVVSLFVLSVLVFYISRMTPTDPYSHIMVSGLKK